MCMSCYLDVVDAYILNDVWLGHDYHMPHDTISAIYLSLPIFHRFPSSSSPFLLLPHHRSRRRSSFFLLYWQRLSLETPDYLFR